jgi:hypothetical protein
MVDRGFASDAAYFDVVAYHTKDPADQQQLREVADAYRSLAARAELEPLPSGFSRADHWRQRAERCRILYNEFTSAVCRQQLLRLASTYEHMASTYEDLPEAS